MGKSYNQQKYSQKQPDSSEEEQTIQKSHQKYAQEYEEQSPEEDQIQSDDDDYNMQEEYQDFDEDKSSDLVERKIDKTSNNVLDWGNKRSNFHKLSSDSDKLSEEEEQQQEAEQIFKLQQQRMKQTDYLEDFLDQKQNQNDANNFELENENQEQLPEKFSEQLNLDEIQPLIDQLSICLENLNNNSSLYELKQSKKILVAKGTNYLDVSSQTLQSYIICILYYLMLKKEGKFVKNHPIIKKLISFKSILNQLEQYSTEFIQSIQPFLIGEIEELEQKQDPKTKSKKKNKKIKQNIQKNIKNQQSNKAPKNLTNNLEENNLLGNQITKNLLELSDEEDKRIQGNQNFNNDLSNSSQDSYAEGGDFDHDDGDDSDINLDTIKLDKVEKTKSSNKINNKKNGGTALKQPKQQNSLSQNQKNADQQTSSEDEFYKNAKKAQQNQKSQIKQDKKQHKQEIQEQIQSIYKQKQVEEEDPRKISYNILKNKGGLFRKRKKIDRNSRVKLKVKYGKQVHKLKSKVQFARPKQLKYKGETLGIKATVLRGVSLKGTNN